MEKSCPECGFPIQGNERTCPECGYPLAENVYTERNMNYTYQEQSKKDCVSEKKDWANYIYECALIFWNVFCHKFANPYGRASRREYWSFSILAMLFSTTIVSSLILIIPWICVSIRRMHDINKCGWWSCVPFACFFMYLKKSDEGENRYGNPNPATNLIY